MVLPSRYAVNETEAYLHCGLEGLGLIQLSALAASPHLRSGRLLRSWRTRCEPVQLSIVYPQARATAAVKAFVQWVLDSSRPVLAA